MFVFLDFEASSLAKDSYPIEVGWVFEDGRSEGILIRPAPEWTDWDMRAQAVHQLDRGLLLREGRAHSDVAAHMLAELGGHDLFASAPSWDGKWLSVLLRAAGLPRRSLRLRDTDEASRETASAILSPLLSGEALTAEIADILTFVDETCAQVPRDHRAVGDARGERERWLNVRAEAQKRAAAQAAKQSGAGA